MSVAILVPAYNEEQVLDKTLKAAVREVGPENVYVADDCSKDLTAHIGRFWTGGNVYTAHENQGKSRTLKGTIDYFNLTESYEGIFILDADTWLSPGHVSALERELETGVAFVVGRIESEQVRWNFWTAYRGFSMWMYNAVIRTPQNVLNTINVLPGSSVLLNSEAVKRIDWQRASRLMLDDFSMLCDVRYQNLGSVKYLHDAPPALIAEPLTFNAYLKQTYDRWWPGIWQTMRDRKMLLKTDWFSITNNLQILSWVWSAIAPVLLILAYLLLQGTTVVWLVPVMIAWQLGQMYVFAGLYAYHKRRPSALLLLPAFAMVAYLESVLFTLAYFKSRKLESGGRWESPARIKVATAKR
ncbi:MAG: glycosyltransferase family 2 protein [Rubrobacter sp.]|jgi:cellulose synthase/poly-beta-1,6-N-acetylglucosamine synthase-like glycosyltransferase|nr:glycosyltransferase family 2 protein [Rubrobacter sp.]